MTERRPTPPGRAPRALIHGAIIGFVWGAVLVASIWLIVETLP